MMNKTSCKMWGIGRRKTATASIELIPTAEILHGTQLEVNGKSGKTYFHSNLSSLTHIHAPLKKLKLMDHYQILASVKGGGLTAQAKAIQLAVARALANFDVNTYRRPLKREGFLSRDARIKERRKYGLKKARKASQSSKR